MTLTSEEEINELISKIVLAAQGHEVNSANDSSFAETVSVAQFDLCMARLKQAGQEVSRRAADLAQLRNNAFSKARDIPAEILVHIISFFHCDGKGKETPLMPVFRLRRVCRSWKSTIEEASLLWRSIDASLPAEHLPMVLEHSKSVDLHVSLWMADRQQKVPKLPSTRINDIVHSVSRWGVFKAENFSIKGLQILVERPAPRLRSCDITAAKTTNQATLFQNLEEISVLSIFADQAPNLQYLTLRGFGISWNSSMLRGLVKLWLEDTPRYPTVERLAVVLRDCPNLEELAIVPGPTATREGSLGITTNDTLNLPPRVTTSRLRTIRLSAPHMELFDWLCIMDFAVCTDLSIAIEGSSPDASRLAPLNACSQQCLNHLMEDAAALADSAVYIGNELSIKVNSSRGRFSFSWDWGGFHRDAAQSFLGWFATKASELDISPVYQADKREESIRWIHQLEGVKRLQFDLGLRELPRHLATPIMDTDGSTSWPFPHLQEIIAPEWPVTIEGLIHALEIRYLDRHRAQSGDVSWPTNSPIPLETIRIACPQVHTTEGVAWGPLKQLARDIGARLECKHV